MSYTVLITEMHQPTDKYGYPEGRKELYVSHGVDSETLSNVILPFEPLTYFTGRKYYSTIGEWILEGENNDN